MTAQFARPQQRGRPGPGQPHEPHAALLIDFDNVTMGIRSDLTKELKNLLNSDIIKGKVAVQRAYADWRRYPQYIVPLAESSVDLIFAPAYGSAKKNATDIRLAIDAIELVFTRPEIGTIILLSGDSDFSSMVLKLKEYGKYVIGVGIRESASDLLVQNCDEYYSYSALTGLTRAGDEAPAVSEDPWELVEMALRQMRENEDVMRSDRLKQVLLELDPSFDEKALGFQKFNKFLQEAASRGLLSLRKQDNGQFEIGPPDAAAVAESQADARGEARRGRGRRGRGRRDEGRREETRDRGEPRREPLAAPQAAAPLPAPDAAIAVAPDAERAAVRPERARPAAERPAAPAEPARVQPAAAAGARETARPKPELVRTEREAGLAAVEAVPVTPDAVAERPRRAAVAKAETEPSRIAAESAVPDTALPDTAPPAAAGAREARPAPDLAASYALLRRATSDLVKKSGQAARDSDVKRRMLELEAGWDESALGFSKFSRFLRQAHDADVITLRKDDNGVYDVLPGNGETVRAEEPRPGRDRDRERGRGRRGRDRDRAPADGARPGEPAAAAAASSTERKRELPAEPARTTLPAEATPAAREERAAERSVPGTVERPAPAAAAPAAGQRAVPAPPTAARPMAPAAAAQKSAAPAALLFRRGSRGRGAAAGPPPLLEGQTAAVRLPGSPARASAAPVPAAEPPAAVAERPVTRPADSRPAVAGPPADRAAERQPAEAAPDSVAAALGLPQDAAGVAAYIAVNYRGVGPKSVQVLIDEFGPGRVFDALENVPERVRELLGARGERLLQAWQEDVRRRRRDAGTAAPPAGGGRRPAKRAAGKGAPASQGTARAPAAAAPAASTAGAAAKGRVRKTPPAPRKPAAAADTGSRAPAPALATPPAAKRGRTGGSRRGTPPTK